MDERGIARIFSQNSTVVGAGFLVGETTIVTCAHVVVDALGLRKDFMGRPKGALQLDFPLRKDEKIYQAHIADWWPREANGAGDMAVLTLLEAVTGVENFFFQDEEPAWGREVRVFGFPVGAGYQEGIWIKGREMGRNGLNQMQIEAESNMAVRPGFSGSPVWDAHQGGIVGLMVVADANQKVSFAIPVETLAKVIPTLTPRTSTAVFPDHFLVPYPRQLQFIGREEELKALHEKLSQANGKIVALTGMGGIGKTALAVQYAHRFRRVYPGGVYWFNAAGSLIHPFAELACKLDKADSTTDELDAARQAWVYLKNQRDALLIFDDMADPKLLKEPFAQGLCAQDLPCWVLVTSRKKSTYPTFDVDILAETSALQLLLRKRPEVHPASAEWVHAQAICDTVGHLPLALELIAAHLEYSEGTLAEYHARLEKEKEFILTAPEVIQLTPREISLEAVLQSQWKEIQKDTARTVLLTAGQFTSLDTVPFAWLELLTGLPRETEPGYPSPLLVAVKDLTNISLATRLEPDQLHLHPLVREFAARQVSPDASAFRENLENHLLEALADPKRRAARALSAGELCLRLPWEPHLARLPVLEALREQMNHVETPSPQKIQAALLLTRLSWLQDHPRLTPALTTDEFLNYLELVTRRVHAADPRRKIVQWITIFLDDQKTILNRARAQVLVQRAALNGYLQLYKEAWQDYQMAQVLYAVELERTPNPEDYRTLARIYFGLANIANLEAEKAADEEKPQRVDEASKFFKKASEAAQQYGKDKNLQGMILREWGAAYFPVQDWLRADEYLTQAQELVAGHAYYETRITETFVERYLAEGKTLVETGKTSEALAKFQLANTLARQNIEALLKFDDPESVPLVVAYLLAGECEFAIFQQDPTHPKACEEAREAWHKALQLAEKLGEPAREDDARQKLATLPSPPS